MIVHTKRFSLAMGAETDIQDITDRLIDAVRESGMKNGVVTAFMVGSTGALSTMEYEPGLKKDVPRALEGIAPSGIPYEHHKTWGDDNGKSHVRSALIGCSLSVPFVDGKLVLGTWQQAVALNLDTSARNREIVLQVLGE
jgi:secondary thiamine-phosphate synthase enzyme